MAEPIGGLLDQIERWPTGVPVRLMEQVIEFGEDALPTVLERIPPEDDEDREPLWYLAVLAELRSLRAVPALIEHLTNTNDLLLRVIASEALAKVGAAAVPALRQILSDGSDDCRLYAYGALGWIEGDAALDVLLDALKKDAPLAHVVANAIAEHQRREVVPALYEAYQRCQPWQRAELADAIHHVHWSIRHPQPVHSDWRFRYFNCGPPLGIDIGWLGICAILYDDLDHVAAAEHPPLRTLEDILGTAAEHAHAAEHCDDCGALIEYPTGMPVCPETALGVVRLQLDHLQEEREHGLDDIFDVLNEVDVDLWDAINAPEPTSKKKRAAQQAQLEELTFLKDTCRWCIEQGAETIGPARARLLAEIGRLADQHGAPADRPAPRTPIVRVQPKVGRNDPCPCGSGKKHKNCCLA